MCSPLCALSGCVWMVLVLDQLVRLRCRPPLRQVLLERLSVRAFNPRGSEAVSKVRRNRRRNRRLSRKRRSPSGGSGAPNKSEKRLRQKKRCRVAVRPVAQRVGGRASSRQRSASCSPRSSTCQPSARKVSSVRRFRWQFHAKRFQTGVARLKSGPKTRFSGRTCSTMCSVPPGRSTRSISRSAATARRPSRRRGSRPHGRRSRQGRAAPRPEPSRRRWAQRRPGPLPRRASPARSASGSMAETARRAGNSRSSRPCQRRSRARRPPDRHKVFAPGRPARPQSLPSALSSGSSVMSVICGRRVPAQRDALANPTRDVDLLATALEVPRHLAARQFPRLRVRRSPQAATRSGRRAYGRIVPRRHPGQSWAAHDVGIVAEQDHRRVFGDAVERRAEAGPPFRHVVHARQVEIQPACRVPQAHTAIVEERESGALQMAHQRSHIVVPGAAPVERRAAHVVDEPGQAQRAQPGGHAALRLLGCPRLPHARDRLLHGVVGVVMVAQHGIAAQARRRHGIKQGSAFSRPQSRWMKSPVWISRSYSRPCVRRRMRSILARSRPVRP